jgi:hypothetical protein
MSDRDALITILAKATAFEWAQHDNTLSIRQDIIDEESYEDVGLSAVLQLSFNEDDQLLDVSLVFDAFDVAKWSEVKAP